jgi:hypothetical protein
VDSRLRRSGQVVDRPSVLGELPFASDSLAEVAPSVTVVEARTAFAGTAARPCLRAALS